MVKLDLSHFLHFHKTAPLVWIGFPNGGRQNYSTYYGSHFFRKFKFSILNFLCKILFLFKLSLRWTLHRQLQGLKIITLDVNGCAVEPGETLHVSWDKICICICFFSRLNNTCDVDTSNAGESCLWLGSLQNKKKVCANNINTD